MRACFSRYGLWAALCAASPSFGAGLDCPALLGVFKEGVGIHPLYELPLAYPAAAGMYEHVFKGQAVMPGAAFLSNALQAASLLDPKLPVVTLEPFVIEAPLLLPEVRDASVLLTQISSVQKRRASVSVGSRDGFNRLTLQAAGEVKIAKSWPKDMGDAYPLFSAKGEAISGEGETTSGEGTADAAEGKAISAEGKASTSEGEAISNDSLYETFDRIGLTYGPLFRRVLALSVHDFWVDALVEPAPGEKGVIHPAFLDSVLQTLVAPLIAAESRRLREGAVAAPPRAAIPLFFGRVTWNASAPPASVYRVRAHLINGLPLASDSQIEYRVLVTTLNDVPVLQIEEGRLGVLKEDFKF